MNASNPQPSEVTEFPTVIIGAGPAGLTAAYELSQHAAKSVVLEADDVMGGISRTAEYKGYRFDIGGHRFFTKVDIVDRIWREVLGDDLIRCSRSSRLLFRGKFFKYPIEPIDVFMGLGPVESVLCAASYLKSALSAKFDEMRGVRAEDFETYVSNRFGRRLYLNFFKTYTEKVWGIPCREIRAEWAAQRIKGLSIKQIVLDLIRVRAPSDKSEVIKSLIRAFDYPRLGPGMMWSRMREVIEARSAQVVTKAEVTRILWQPGRILGVEAGGKIYRASNYISSMPIVSLVEALDPPAPASLSSAKRCFSYRDFLTVALIVDGDPPSADNWIYVHDPGVKVGRVQIFNNWSSDMVPTPGKTCFGMEYFCFEGDELWSSEDGQLLALATRELERIGLAKASSVRDGTVVRQPKAYPVYDRNFREGLKQVREFLTQVPNLQLIGRNGMHKYNNQDHSMLTGIMAARNILGARYDLWRVNLDTEYQEVGGNITDEQLKALEDTQPLVPERRVATASGPPST